MSQIVLTINNRTASGLPINFGSFTIVINYGSGNIPLKLDLSNSTGVGRFNWRGVPDNGINGSALNYAAAFNRDFRNIGGVNNLNAVVTGNNRITITSVIGEFISASENSDIASLSSVINNTPLADPIVFSVLRTNTGTCSNITYELSATGGTPPFTGKRNGIADFISWNGNSFNVTLLRGTFGNYEITDSLGNKRTTNYIVPRGLIASDFTVEQIFLIGSTDIIVNTSVVVANTNPLTYSLDGIDYQTSNSFTGLFEGTQTIYIKDVYGCVTEKVVSISVLEDNLAENPRIFIISKFNSFSFARSQNFNYTTKKNFYNTNSYNELIQGVRYINSTKLLDGQVRRLQFKSSLPFHIITAHRCDGTKFNISFEKIQQNINTPERVDCKLFQESDGFVGVYFDGGNKYVPDTTSILEPSEYTNALPKWGEDIGRIVNISGLGLREIIDVKYNFDLSKFYFVVSGISDQRDAIVQVNYNVQDYDLYECIVNKTTIRELSILTIELGFSFDEIIDTYVSEPIELIEDNDDLLIVEWKANKNIGDMVFQSGFVGQMVLEGSLRRYAKGEAEVVDSEDRTYALDIQAREGVRLTLEVLTANEWSRLNLATTVSKSGALGVFTVNGMELVRNTEITQTEYLPSNISKVVLDFDYGGESTAIQNNELVLDISTGVVGGGGDGVLSLENLFKWDEKERLAIDGVMLTIDGKTIVLE